MSNDTEKIGTAAVSVVNGEAVVHRADDLIEVAGELAEQFGVKPPLDGRIEFAPDYVYDLVEWSGQGMYGRYPGTYLGRRVKG